MNNRITKSKAVPTNTDQLIYINSEDTMPESCKNFDSEEKTINKTHKHHALIIAPEEITRINISKRLSERFKFNTIAKNSTEEAIDHMTSSSTELIIIDIDNISYEAITRLHKIIHQLQIPCLFIGSDPTFLNNLRLDMDLSFISFLPKGILSTMFNDTLEVLLKKTNQSTKLTKRLMSIGPTKKPFLFYVLAFALISEPLIKILYLKLQTGLEWEVLARTILSIEGISRNFEFWAIFPLTGYALLKVSAWSFISFITLQIYSLFTYFTYEEFTWPYVAKSPQLSVGLLLTLNSALVLYFLAPANRRPYWNKMRKLWRNSSRYTTSLKSQFSSDGHEQPTTITNLSETGAYFTSTTQFPIGHRLKIEIPITGEHKSLDAIVRRSQETAHQNYYGHGVEFNYKNKSQKNELKEFLISLKPSESSKIQ